MTTERVRIVNPSGGFSVGNARVVGDMIVVGNADPSSVKAVVVVPFQDRVVAWMESAFGPDWREDRAHRFFEEALELAQASGCAKADAQALLDRVFDRPRGDVYAEVGDVMLTLAGLSGAVGVDMAEAAENGLDRATAKTDAIRAKRARRQPGSPLPGDDA
jgi:NTP pyrophosphatase (non-canonical NTP hydrolase)